MEGDLSRSVAVGILDMIGLSAKAKIPLIEESQERFNE
jgi:hypothetical protein